MPVCFKKNLFNKFIEKVTSSNVRPSLAASASSVSLTLNKLKKAPALFHEREKVPYYTSIEMTFILTSVEQPRMIIKKCHRPP